MKRLYSPGIGAAFISAVFSGASTPLAKILAGEYVKVDRQFIPLLGLH
jgi:hypothetical protein